MPFVEARQVLVTCDGKGKDAKKKALDGIVIPLVGQIEQLETELAEAKSRIADFEEILKNPVAVHINMVKGTIAWTEPLMRSLLGDTQSPAEMQVLLTEARSEIARLQACLVGLWGHDSIQVSPSAGSGCAGSDGGCHPGSGCGEQV